MSKKRFCSVFFALAALLSAPAAFAHQNGPQPGTHITVAKTGASIGLYEATYGTIQAAVNNAQPNQVIEILDEGEYAEQVTIDGRVDAPWGSNVAGGKSGITIKYVPPAGAALSARPTIKYRDQTNISPKTCDEAKNQGDAVGTSGNFETNAALRIIRASGIVIEGLIVDGGGSSPFSANNVWQDADPNNPKLCTNKGKCTAGGENDPEILPCPLFHGNAAITLAISHNVQIRDCQIRNAYFGVYVKDRNTGGIFGNPNPADNDVTIPLSGFGQTGNHLIEYNRIHANDVGLFFESCWDLASTVRHNLIYSNGHTAEPAGYGSKSDKAAAGIVFKDIYLTPLAIYNNTFYMNTQHLVGLWQIGYHHLIFNNIFGRITANRPDGWDEGRGSNPYDYITVEDKFANRMKHCVWASDRNATGGFKKFTDVSSAGGLITGSKQDAYGAAVTFPTAGTANPPANIYWLETPLNTTAATTTSYLEPEWSNANVTNRVKNKGWATSGPGMLNADGSAADLGAVPSDSGSKRPCDGKQQTTRVRVSPWGFVTITGTTATAKITISQEVGALSGLTVKYLRWITPVPDNAGQFGRRAAIVPGASIREVTYTTPAGGWQAGNNQVPITITGTAGTYGFFEIVFEGKDAGGKNVTTDVGFLPYRQLDYWLDIKLSGSGVTTTGGVPTVQAGTPVTMTVTAMDRSKNAKYNPTAPGNTRPLDVRYSLSLPTSRIFQTPGDAPLTPLAEDKDNILTGDGYSKTYTVYFTKAMESEVITASGLWCNGDCANSNTNRLVFPGDLAIRVRPGPPEKIVFQDPVSNKQLGGATPATIVNPYPVTVQVQDRYDNPVDVAVALDMVSLQDTIGTVEQPTASTDPATGNASFTAIITKGNPGDIFHLAASSKATKQSGGALDPDTGSLRVGRASDALRLLYFQDSPPKHGNQASGRYWMDDFRAKDAIDTTTNVWQPVWIKVISGDTVKMRNADNVTVAASICVTSDDPNILFSADGSGAGTEGPYLAALTGGVAAFWIMSKVNVEAAILSVEAKTTANCAGEKDNAFQAGNRGNITFTQSSGNIVSAAVAGGGDGRPNFVRITYKADNSGGNFSTWQKPDSVTLQWPGICAGAQTLSATDITVRAGDSLTLEARFANSVGFPGGYSGPVAGTEFPGGLVTVYNAIEDGSGSPSTLIDSIGPLIADVSRGPLCGYATQYQNPSFDENKSPGTPFTLRLQLTEELKSTQTLLGPSLLISPTPSGDGQRPDPLYVESIVEPGSSANNYVYTLTVRSIAAAGAAADTTLVEGYWIKLNDKHATPIADVSDNAPHADNRRVRLGQQEVPATVEYIWYTTDDATGKADYLYIVFDKEVEDVPTWFAGGSLRFVWGGVSSASPTLITADNVNGIVTPLAREPRGVRVDLAKAFPEAVKANADIMTSGFIQVDGSFGTLKPGWPDINKQAYDYARPVLIAAELLIGAVDDDNNYAPDTLALTFSEAVKGFVTGAPVSILTQRYNNDPGRPVTLRVTDPAPRVENVGAYYKVSYVVADGGMVTNAGFEPQSGDSVKINPDADISDDIKRLEFARAYFGDPAADTANVQNNPDNRRVELKIRSSPLKWKTSVKNNPFRSGHSVTFETTPNAKGDTLTVTAAIKLYDNMGNLVRDTTKTNDLSHLDPTKRNSVEWAWDGRNHKGRTVGTGTYLLKAVYEARRRDGTTEPRHIVNQSVGFVRGKAGR